MKRQADAFLAGTLLLFAACSVVALWLYMRYQQAERAFRNSLGGQITLGSNGKVTVPGGSEQALAESRLHVFYIFFAITTVLAVGLLVQVYLRRKRRLRSVQTTQTTEVVELP